jgi:signal transduction histidine kinase
MTNSPNYRAIVHQPSPPAAELPSLPLPTIRRRFGLLRWLLPLGLLLFVFAYEVGPSRWIHDNLGDAYHFAAEILLYGTVGPILAFILLNFIGRWLEERETSELQAQVLAQAREQARLSHKLSDDTLQALFATSVLLAALESNPNLPPEAAVQLQEAQRALNHAIQQLQVHLLNNSSSAEK